MICNFMIFSESVGSGASLSAETKTKDFTKAFKNSIKRLSNKFWAVSFYSFNRLKNKLKK